MQSPLIDILVPTYEPDPAFLKAAIESAIHQTETRWQMFIHDDASTVDVKAIVEPYLKDERITFERSDHRLGIGGNWNACLNMCHPEVLRRSHEGRHIMVRGSADAEHLTMTPSPYIQFLFQDDLWKPHYLEKILHALEKNPTAGFVSADHDYDCTKMKDSAAFYASIADERHGISGGLHGGHVFLQTWIESELHPNLIGEPSFVMLRRSTVEKVGRFREDMPQFLDVEYWIRCLMATDLYHVTENLGTFRVHGGGASAQNQMTGVGIYDRLRCFEMLISKLPKSALKTATIRARDRALTDMARKFLQRLGSKKSIPAKGTGGMTAFALKHPFLVLKSLFKALRKSP
ncbi:MAG TPA: glycosyltransferase [Candidatus Peribacteraceae bacterium]|nr:glycosyltransferase [Candidatus Peribacteraceae bacterium]